MSQPVTETRGRLAADKSSREKIRVRKPVEHHAAQSIPAVAARLRGIVSEYELRRAVERGEVEAVSFGGRKRIPPQEERRIRELLSATEIEK